MADESLEITSKQLRLELQQIKERLTTLESIDVHLRRDQIVALVEKVVGGKEERKKILHLCESPRTLEEIQSHLGKNSKQALTNHINPLKDEGLLEPTVNDAGKYAYVRSRIISRLRPSDRKRILE